MRPVLFGCWIAAVLLETGGNAAGFLPIAPRWQWLLGLVAMLGYGAVCMAISRTAPHFLQAWPLGYAFVYFTGGLVVAKVLGNSFSKAEILGALLIVSGFTVSLWGDQLRSVLR